MGTNYKTPILEEDLRGDGKGLEEVMTREEFTESAGSQDAHGTLEQAIPRKEWAEFFTSFTDRYQTWLVSIERVGPELQSRIEAENQPLLRVSADFKGSGSISILLGKGSSRISGPTRVWLKKNKEGADEALKIESANGGATILRFRSPMLPEMVDHVMNPGQ